MESSFKGQSISPWPYHILHIILHIKLRRNICGTGIWIFKSDPNLVVNISLNPGNSGDSNGGIHASIPTLGDENRNLPSFCLPALPR